MNKQKLVLFAILLIGFAQSQSWKILTIDKNKIKFDNLSNVQNDTLVGIESGEVIEVPVQNILSIRYGKTSLGWGILGGCIGYPIGAILGAFITVIASDNYETGLPIGAVIGPIAGFLLLSKLPYFGKQHNFDNMTLEQKVDKINALIAIYDK